MILLLVYGPFILCSVITFFCGSLFQKTGLSKSLASYPFVNVAYWSYLIRLRPILLSIIFIPIVNILFLTYLYYRIKHVFSKPQKFLPARWNYIWVDLMLFIVINRLIINTFIFSVYNIPTSSMEKTYLIGDMIIAEKVSYGPKLPNTPIALPFTQGYLPFTHVSSYYAGLQLPYLRLWGNSCVKRNDVVVFNYPIQDKLPVDRRIYFMKRCVAVPGDNLQILNAVVHVNGKPMEAPAKSQKMCLVKTDGTEIDFRIFERLGITDGGKYTAEPGLYMVSLTAATKDSLKAIPYVKTIIPSIKPSNTIDEQGRYFPPDTGRYKWNVDQYGPLVVPKKFETVSITLENIAMYERIIKVYEHHQLQVTGNSILIDGKPTTTYTFQMNYYFMMGDNRDDSEDSRFWGFVPEDHIDSKVCYAVHTPAWLNKLQLGH